MTHPEIELTYDPTAADLQFLDDRLYEFNSAATGQDDGSLFALYLRDVDGEILAGLSGWVWAKACEIRLLWVHPSLRGSGIGAELLTKAEAEARAKGCEVIMLNTYSFQAPRFYPKFGYTLVAKMADFPPGSQNFIFQKRLI